MLAPFLDSFVDELQKIARAKHAMAGALVGGYLGSKLPGNKLVGAATGAVVGHGVGALAKGVKRQVWDEQQQREHQALYGHIPSHGREDQLGTHF